jgi:hypothetical protein
MMQLILIVLTKRKETIRYYESFGYGGKCALDKCFYRSNGVSVPTEEGSIIPIMGISHHPHIMSFSNHPLRGLFTNKFLHVSINNKIISINKNKHTQFLIVLQSHKQQNKLKNNKRRLTHQNHCMSSLMQFRRGI